MRQIFVAFYLTISLFIFGHADAATEPKILQLQSQLAELSEKREKLNQSYHDELAENANAMKEKEQSTANKTLGAASMGAMGIGGMMVASSLAEQNANADAERDMAAYLATFRCDYGAGMNIRGGETGIELPGAAELIPLYAEYVSLANDLKARKEQLGMKPGIESEPILDSATTGLYDDVSTGITSGAYASLARAMQNPDGEDAKKWSESQDEIAKKLKTGAITAGAGAVVGVVGDMIVNKDAPKERSAEIKTEYESNLNNLEQEIATTQSELDAAIAANAQLVDEYNNLLQQHMDFIATMVHEDCKSEQSEYIEAIKALSPITDNTTDMSDMKIPYDLAQQQEIYRLCIQRYETLAMALADIEAQTDADIAALDDEIEIEDFTIDPFDTTIDIAPIQINGNDNKDNTAGDNDNNNGENNAIADNQCPDENPRLSTLNSSHHVGDSCTYGNVTVGYVQKYKSGKYAGTCTCVATACKTGYVVENGVCKEKTANQSDDNTPPVALQMPEIKFYDVCKDDRGKSGGTEYCIDKPFNWTDVQMLQATALAAEYAYVQNGHTVRCENDENKIRKSGNDDYISCTSTDNKHFYEFKFNDVAESTDSDIQLNIINALCKGVYSGTIPRKDGLGQHLCKIPDKSKHAALKESASKFNIQSNISSEGVWLTQPGVNDTYTTKKIDGIDPFAFYSGDIQIRANGVMIDGLYEYAALQLAPHEIKTFTCKSNPFQVSKTIDGRRVKGTTDDVLKCYVNGTAVDFVFDDMSELSKKLSRGGYSNMNCTVAGGAYNGYDCMYVGKTQCERIRKLSAATMPANKLPFWNANTQECELPAAADATEYQQNINMGIMVGGVIVGVVITVATGGIGAPAALAMLTVETAGGVMEIAATQKIYDAIEEFIENSKKCNDAICAEAMLRDNLQRMADMTFDITDAQMNGIDRELERLANLIPTDSEFYQSLASQGTSLDANNKGIKHWQPEQIWRAVGIAMQLASVITSIGKWAFGKANKLPRVTTAIANRADDAIRMTASQAKRLDEIDARLIRIQSELDANPSASRAADLRAERTRLTQEKNTILNKVGTKNADDINNAKAAARSADEIATAQRELDDARAALRKRLDWESKNPGAAKNDLQSKNSNGRKLRNDVRAAEQKLRDMGESVTPMEFTDPDDIVRGASRASDDASDASRGTDNTAPGNDAGARGADNIDSRPALREKAKDASRGLTTDNIVQDGKLNEELLDDLIQEGGPVYIDRTNLDSTHIRSLNKKFKDAGFEIDNGNGGTVFGFKKSASNADDVARAANSATDAASAVDDAPLTGVALRSKASSNFDSHLAKFKSDGTNAGLPKSRMTDAEWARLNDELASDDVRLVEYTTKDGRPYMRFESTKPINNATSAVNAGARNLSKAEKIEDARRGGHLGYHGTDADIAMDDMIRPSANTSDRLGSVGYGIAKDYDAAEKYAVRRLIERQNPGKTIDFYREGNVLVIKSDAPLDLSKKTGYVYTTAKDPDIKWTVLNNGYVGSFDAAQMPNAVEILDKKTFNLDDLIRDGRVRIDTPQGGGQPRVEPRRTSHVADNIDDVGRATTSRTIFGDINISPADKNIIETAISKKHAGTLSRAEHIKAIRTMDKYFNEPATRNFAHQMRRNLMDVFRNDINKTSELIEGLYNGNGISFVEFILDNLGPKYGIPRGTIRIQFGVFDQPGYALYANKNFYLNTAHPHNAEEIINLVIHEFTHAIDDLSPQNGVIGKTLNAWGDNANLYVRHGELMDGTQDMYKLIPTERSAHLVGDIVSGTTEYGTAPMANTTNLAHEIANLL